MEERDYEAEARHDGWVPQDEWNGSEDKWTDAQTFVENGEKIAGIAVKKSRKLEHEVEEMKEQLAEVRKTNVVLNEHYKGVLERERKEKQDLIGQLEQEREDAISTGDGQKFTQVDKQINDLRSTPDKSQDQSWMIEWAENNEWYANDKAMRYLADGMAHDLEREGFIGGSKDFLDEVATRVKKEMPHKFENPKRKEVITSGDERKSPEEISADDKSFEALPDDVKAVCQRFVKDGLMTQEEYLTDYYG